MRRLRWTGHIGRRAGLLTALLALAAAGALVAAGTASAGTTTVQAGQQNGGAGAALQFNAASIVVNAGDTVHWAWFSGGSHTVTAWSETTPGTPDWGSGTICVGVCPAGSVSTFDHIFTSSGVYTYYCSFHALRAGADPSNVDSSIGSGLMVGKITVIDARVVGGVAHAPDPASLVRGGSGSSVRWRLFALPALGALAVAAGALGLARRSRRAR